MSAQQVTNPSTPLTLRRVINLAFIIQPLLLIPLWQHQSTSGEFLGRYSNRYAIILFASVAVTLTWLLLMIFQRRVTRWLSVIPVKGRLLVIGISGAAMYGLWHVNVEVIALGYLSINWLLSAVLLLLSTPDQPLVIPRWHWIVLVIAVVMLIPMGFTAVTTVTFSPDEAHYADSATSYYYAEGVYSRTWLHDPVTILPGVGWSVPAYGWLLRYVSMDIRVGRLVNLFANLFAFAGIGLAAGRLYGRKAAAVSVAFAALSMLFVPVMDYRPNHQLPVASAFALFTAVQARFSTQGTQRNFWHLATGLLATLSLQLHAAGIVLASGLSLFYLAEFVLGAIKRRRIDSASLQAIVSFGAGALLGTGTYYLFNIVPVGGLQVYLTNLREQAWNVEYRSLGFLRWPSPLESLFVWGALAYLVWRRNNSDRLLLGILASVMIAAAVLDTQGYLTSVSAFYMVPVGAMLLGAFSGDKAIRGMNRHSIMMVAITMTIMVAQISGNFINWADLKKALQTGEIPVDLYDVLEPELSPHLRDDDIIASTGQLIWLYPESPTVVNVAAEYLNTVWRGFETADEVWEWVQPTVVVYIEREMSLSPGLQTYMDNHEFEECQLLNVLHFTIHVLREVCPE